MADSFSLLADYADQLHTTTLGSPTKPNEFQAVKKATKSKGAVPISIKPVADSFIDKKQNIVIDSGTAEIIEASLRDLYALLNTKDDTMIKLMRSNNKTLNKVVNTITEWFSYEQERDLMNKLEKHGHGSDAEEALADAKADTKSIQDKRDQRKRDQQEQRQSDGPSIDIDTSKDKKKGEEHEGHNKKTNVPHEEQVPKKKGWFKRGWEAVKGMSPSKKIAGLLAAGALGTEAIANFPTFGTHTPEALDAAIPNAFRPPITTVPETGVERASTTEHEPNAATKSIANAFGEGNEKPSLMKKGMNLVKGIGSNVVPKALGALSVASAGLDAYKVEQDPTLTRTEKNEAHAGQAGQVVGTMGATMAGEVVGGALGFALGSVFPGAGNILGAEMGSQIGGLIAGTAASILGSDQMNKAGKAIYDFFVKDVHEDKPQRIQLALDDVKVKTDIDGNKSSILPDSIKPYTERNYSNPTMSPTYSGSNGYSGIPDSYRAVVNGTASAGSIGGYANTPALGVLKDLKGVDRTENRLSQWNDLFERNGAANGVDPRLIRAVTKQESKGFTDVEHATSHSGAGGLMQLMPATAREQGVMNAYDPEQNVAGGSKYLAIQLRKYKGNVPLALAAYNAGSGNVDKAIAKAGTRDPDAVLAALPQVTGSHAKETQDYVRNITGFYSDYKNQTSPNQIQSPDVKADSTVKAPDPAQKQMPETQATNVVSKPVLETPRNDLTTNVAAYNQPKQEIPQQNLAPLPPSKQGRGGQMQVSQASHNQTTIPTLDDMPLTIDEFGLTHLNLGGA